MIQEAKLRLNLAIAPGIWLMPSNLVINTESVTGYNNYLLKASGSMTFGINDLVNEQTKQVGLEHNLGINKINLPSTNDTKNIKLQKNVLPLVTKVEKDTKLQNKH